MFNQLEKINIAADHGGWELKEKIKNWLMNHPTYQNILLEDFGTFNDRTSVDYPDFAAQVCKALKADTKSIGILVCGSGQGMAMGANKFNWIRAALVWSKEISTLSRQHNNANVLCLGGRVINHELALECVETFLSTPFEGGRHEQRVNKLKSFKNTEY